MINKKFCCYSINDFCITEFRIGLKGNRKVSDI